MDVITKTEQLVNPDNFELAGELFLVFCVACQTKNDSKFAVYGSCFNCKWPVEQAEEE